MDIWLYKTSEVHLEGFAGEIEPGKQGPQPFDPRRKKETLN